MKKLIRLVLILILFSCTNTRSDNIKNEWIPLWNGEDLTGWSTFFASPYSGIDKTQDGFLGLNNDSQDVIQVVDLEDGNAIRISGVSWGMMFTEKDYENYLY